jgi:hypothetical protein
MTGGRRRRRRRMKMRRVKILTRFTPFHLLSGSCYGPGTFWKNGTKINYDNIKGKIDTTCR